MAEWVVQDRLHRYLHFHLRTWHLVLPSVPAVAAVEVLLRIAAYGVAGTGDANAAAAIGVDVVVVDNYYRPQPLVVVHLHCTGW